MIRHLDEGTLQALLDGEVPPVERAAAEAHLASCPACAAELKELRAAHESVSLLLGRVDAPAPVAQAQMSFRGRRAATAAPAPSRFGEATRALLRAAALVLGLAGVAAAAVPGSPVREWIEETILPSEASTIAEEPTVLEETPPAPAAEEEAAARRALPAVLGDPVDGRITVDLTGIASGVRVRLGWTRDTLAAVYTTRLGRDDKFVTGPGSIGLRGAAGGEVVVEVPVGVGANVRVNGRSWATGDGRTFRVTAPDAEERGGEWTFQVR